MQSAIACDAVQHAVCCGALVSTVYICIHQCVSLSRLRENSSHDFQWSSGHASWVGYLRCDESGNIHQLCLDSRLEQMGRRGQSQAIESGNDEAN